ncbi:hypothetical protein KRR38_05380 [Novosphingobium sp. G106]|uniref:bestrophin-like domain n=1 Tax=Novosphingobium sp. G106 TaxID=2849500 RepID=UPI001C2D69D5|nr:hypothetical protein [Novosphingobium sp. G106]MBV1687119.1 hypothetical protein [Novosphingobium sp. G106]
MASLEHALRSFPLWAIGSVFFLLLLGASLLGGLLRHRLDAQASETQSDGYLLSANLALLGLLIAFTFSLAVSRYDSRRVAVIQEANAIGTAWLRAGLIEGTEGQALRDAIRSYTDVRLRLPEADDRRQVERETASAQALIWQRLRTALPQAQPPVAVTTITAMTEMFDAAATRKAERQARIPGRVLDVLSLYAIMSAGIVGYVLGRKGDRRHLVVSSILFLLLTLAMTLILDLDRPYSGSIKVPVQPLIDTRAGFD